MLTLSPQQIDRLAGARQDAYTARACDYLRRAFPTECRTLTHQQLAEFIRRQVQQAANHGLTAERDVTRFLDLSIVYGPAFVGDAKYPWAEPIFSETQVRPMTRADLAFAAAGFQRVHSRPPQWHQLRYSAIRQANAHLAQAHPELAGRRLSLGITDVRFCDTWLAAFESAERGSDPIVVPPEPRSCEPDSPPLADTPVRAADLAAGPPRLTPLEHGLSQLVIGTVCHDEQSVDCIDGWLAHKCGTGVPPMTYADDDLPLDLRIAVTTAEALNADPPQFVYRAEVIQREFPSDRSAALVRFTTGDLLVFDWYATLDLRDPLVTQRRHWISGG